MDIVILNKSRLTDAEGYKIAHAVRQILPVFCKDWGVPIPSIRYISKTEFFFSKTAIQVRIEDTFGASAYHSFIQDTPFAVIHYRSTHCVSVAVCHEIFELVLNPKLDKCIAGYPLEICDPVTKNSVMVGDVAMSDWVLPSWFSHGSPPYNHLNTLTAPFSLSPGGYIHK